MEDAAFMLIALLHIVIDDTIRTMIDAAYHAAYRFAALYFRRQMLPPRFSSAIMLPPLMPFAHHRRSFFAEAATLRRLR